jgi:type VI protein secretion system component VasF
MRRSSVRSAVRTALLRAAVPFAAAHRAVARGRRHGDRGDVPGWVLVTLMTAGLVAALWGLAHDRLTQVFDTAITSVTG